jgi:hypothetical protein
VVECRRRSARVAPRLVELAAELLSDDDLGSYSIELWAKYTAAADYDQPFHCDYLNHSLLVPTPTRRPVRSRCSSTSPT